MVYKKQNGALTLESAGFEGGRFVASTTSSGTTYQPHYFITDHLGSVRVVVDGNGSVQERNDYYAYGMRWNEGLISATNRYRYNGKEWQGFLNVPYNDHGARMIDTRFRMSWGGGDPLAEKFTEHGLYVFCAGNPIRNVDLDGKKVWPVGKDALKMIQNTLTKEDQRFVQLDKSGSINVDIMSAHTSESGNYNALLTFVKSDTDVKVSLGTDYVYMDNNGNLISGELGYGGTMPEFRDLEGNNSGGTVAGDTGKLGITLLPGKGESGVNSPDNAIHIIVNSALSENSRAEMYSHEANGHAQIFNKTKSRQESAHNFQRGPNGGIYDANKKLVNLIIQSKRETIKNLRAQ